MVAYSNAPYNIAFDVECSPQIVSNFESMHGFAVDGRELVNLVRPQPWIERILLENLKRSCRQSLLFGSHLAKAWRNDLAARKRYFTPALEFLQRVVQLDHLTAGNFAHPLFEAFRNL